MISNQIIITGPTRLFYYTRILEQELQNTIIKHIQYWTNNWYQ